MQCRRIDLCENAFVTLFCEEMIQYTLMLPLECRVLFRRNYALVLRGLRPGQYKIHWKAKDKRGSKTLDVGEDSLFLLQLQDILLE